MKKHFVKAAALLLALSLTACGGKTEGEKNTTSGEKQNTVVNTTPLAQMNVEDLVTLGDYQSLKVTVSIPDPSDDDIYTLMNSVYVGAISAENGGIVDRAVEVGDVAVIDYCGKQDGVAFAGGTAEGADLEIGSHTFIDGFEEGLVGVMPGETVDLNLTFPEAYHNADLAGQEVVFTVTVQYIKPSKVPMEEMKDEVAAMIGLPNVATVEQLKDFIKSFMLESVQEEYQAEVEDQVLNALLEQCTFKELPADLLKVYEDKMASTIAYNAALNNATEDAYSFYCFNKSAADAAVFYGEISLKQDLALQAVANAAGLNVTDEELKSELDKYVADYRLDSVEEFLGDNTEEDFRNYVMNLRVMEYLVANAEITEN